MWRLLDLIFPPRTDEEIVRDLSVDTFLSLLNPQLVDYTHTGTIALYPFSNARVRATLHEAKYHGNEHAFTLLSSALTEYLRDADEITQRNATPVLVPVPLGTARHKARGYNQVEEVLQRTARELGLALATDVLIRTRETSTQVGLPRSERERNMRGAFRAAHSLDPAHLYLVVDDVITTGATLQAAIDALTAAGATQILPITLAH